MTWGFLVLDFLGLGGRVSGVGFGQKFWDGISIAMRCLHEGDDYRWTDECMHGLGRQKRDMLHACMNLSARLGGDWEKFLL